MANTHPEYDQLPESVKLLHSEKQYAWLGSERERIKCLNVSSLWGFVLKYKDICHNATFREKEVIRAGGEILERAKLKRGEREYNSMVDDVEGIKDYKPLGIR